MSEHLSEEELEEWRHIIQAFPKSERDKWQTLVKSGRLVSIVVFLDNICTSLEKLGTFGIWLNKAVKGIIYLVLAIFMFKLLVTGDVSLGDIWKLFVRP